MLTFEKYLADLIRQTTVEWRDVLTDFMPREQIEDHLDALIGAGVHYRIDGGYDDAERVRLFMTVLNRAATTCTLALWPSPAIRSSSIFLTATVWVH